jgi:hypothetical protein
MAKVALPHIVRGIHGYEWQVTPTYKLRRVSKDEVEVLNVNNPLAGFAYMGDCGEIKYYESHRIPPHIKRELPRFYQLTNQHFD